jgi:hypothetical protein
MAAMDMWTGLHFGLRECGNGMVDMLWHQVRDESARECADMRNGTRWKSALDWKVGIRLSLSEPCQSGFHHFPFNMIPFQNPEDSPRFTFRNLKRNVPQPQP